VSTTLIVALPNLTMLGSVTRWGSLFDRVGVVRMRLVNVTCWTLSHVLAFGGAIVVLNADAIGPCCVPIAVALFAGRGVLNGLGIGGGQIAWHIGHLHFARPEEAELYMGVHVSLTGMRALVAPFAGMWLWYTVGWPVWLLAIASSTASFAVYALMARTEPREMSN
jgi:hypothetical protein